MKSESEPRKPHPVRAATTYLIAAAPPGSASWRWRFTTALALIGPGSVPLALALFFSQNYTLTDGYLIEWGALPAAATAVAVVLARFRPVGAWTLVMASYLVAGLAATFQRWQPWPLTSETLIAFMVVLFALGRDRRAVNGVLALGTYLVAVILADWASYSEFLYPQYEAGTIPDYGMGSDSITLGTLLNALALLVGLLIRIRRQARARVEEEERVAESERHRRRLLEERTRIARELHDIVAHHMSVITVQASTAEYRLTGLSEEAREEFRSISDQARESLAEMRRLLGVLRSEDDAGAREPQPGPEALRGLAESVDRTGTPVSLKVAELPEDLPETVALTVFRIVQEALSNVVRHAPGAPTTILVAFRGRKVTVTVVNGPSPERPASESARVEDGAASSGFGLVGMRERVALDGGVLETGPTEGGGFRVHAALPIDDRSTAEESP